MMRRWLLAVLLLLGGPGFAHAQAGCGYSMITRLWDNGCAIRKDDSTVDCWGDEFWFDPVPAGTFVFVDAAYGTCGVKTDGSLDFWGFDPGGMNTVPGGTDYVACTVGVGHVCALTNSGGVTCWGDDNDEGQQTVPAGTYSQVQCNEQTCCGVKTDGSLACWGLGAGDIIADMPAGTGFVEVELAENTGACARKTNGDAECWGDFVPASLSPSTGYKDIALSGSGVFFGILESDCSLVAIEGGVPDAAVYDDRPLAGAFEEIHMGVNSMAALETSGDVIAWGDDLNDEVSEAPATTCDDVACGTTTTTTTTTTLPNYVAMSVGM